MKYSICSKRAFFYKYDRFLISMENKRSNKRSSTLDNFVISSKKPRDENINLNFISNSSSSIATNTLTCSSSSDNSSTCFIGTDAANLTVNTQGEKSGKILHLILYDQVRSDEKS